LLNSCTPSARALTSLSSHGTLCLASIHNTAEVQRAQSNTRTDNASSSKQEANCRTHLFTPVACTHETEHTCRTLVRVVVILLELSRDMRCLRSRSGTNFLRASGPVSRLRTNSGNSFLCASGPASRCVVSLHDGCLPLVLTWAYLARLAARSSTCSSAS